MASSLVRAAEAAVEEMAAKDRRIRELEAALAAATAGKPRCLYEGYANARDYLEAVLELPAYRDLQRVHCTDLERYDAMVPRRCEADGIRVPFSFTELRWPVSPRDDGRKISVGFFQDARQVRKWFKPDETNYLRNCPVYEGDVLLEKLREKHTDEELEDLFYSLQSWEKKTWTETHAEPTPLEAAEAKLEDAERRLARTERMLEDAERRLASALAEPKIRGHTEAELVVTITKIARGMPDATERKVLELWRAHAAVVQAEEKAKAEANAGGEALRSWLGDWLQGGMPQQKKLCGCLEWDCPSLSLEWKKGRGFVDPWHEEEDTDCPCIRPEMCDRCATAEEMASAERAASEAWTLQEEERLRAEQEAKKRAEEEHAAYEAAIRDLEATCAAANAEILERAGTRALMAALGMEYSAAPPPQSFAPKRSWADVAKAPKKV